jgi:hypothetical protein
MMAGVLIRRLRAQTRRPEQADEQADEQAECCGAADAAPPIEWLAC